MNIDLDINSCDDYRTFLKIKSLPSFGFRGRTAIIPPEYDHLMAPDRLPLDSLPDYDPLPSLFDYQRDIIKIAIQKKKYAMFASCGLGKTPMFFEYARYVNKLISPHKKVLMICPLMVVYQTIKEAKKFYSGRDDFKIEPVRSAMLNEWLGKPGDTIGVTNYDALSDRTIKGLLGCLILDESSMLKSDYGKYAQICIRLGEGLDWKLCGTGTPAPNDRTEFANHSVFLDQYSTINAFLSHYFQNTGKTGDKWQLKGHAVDSFYKDLSHWSIFLSNPATYGWKDNTDNIPPINVHMHDVDLTKEQNDAALDGTGFLFPMQAGGITSRSKMSQIAKGRHKGKSIKTNKYTYIKSLVDSWPEESTLIWVLHNAEQDELEKVFPRAASIRGATKIYERERLIDDFVSGHRKVLVSKSRILGLGLNLQIATRHVFSSCVDSFESFFQAIKRSNRIGSTRDLNVHIPLSSLELVMAENVLNKWKRVQADMEVCENIFKERLINTGVLQCSNAK